VTTFWIMPHDGEIELRDDLDAAAIAVLEAKGYERFVIGRGGRHAAIVGYAEDARDVGQLRRLLLQEDERTALRASGQTP